MDTQDQPQPNVDYTIKKPWEEKKSLPVVKGTELFIGNLNIDTIEGELYNLFSPSGIITDIRPVAGQRNSIDVYPPFV